MKIRNRTRMLTRTVDIYSTVLTGASVVSTETKKYSNIPSSELHPYDTDFDVRFKTDDFDATHVIYLGPVTPIDLHHTDTVDYDGTRYTIERVNQYSGFFEVVLSITPEGA